MHLSISHQDISSRLCQRCGACCRIALTIKNTDSRYREFLRTTGFDVQPPVKAGEADCCDKVHDIRIDTGYCKHLEIGADAEGELFRCRLYGSKDLPKMCADYDCVSWSRHDNSYNDGNRLLVTAQTALNRLAKPG